MSRLRIALLLMLAALLCRAQAPDPLPQAAPGHENLPVVFWAHYMPQVPTGNLHANGHIGGNADVYPFIPVHQDKVENAVAHMKSALASGINGFEYLTVVMDHNFEAADRVQAETGKNFYIAPAWCGMGDDPVKAAARIADFARKYAGNPHLCYSDGAQMHFLYSEGKWSGPTADGRSGVAVVQEILRGQGLYVKLLPTIGSAASTLLDRPDLRYKGTALGEEMEPGPMAYMASSDWDGATSLNGSANMRDAMVRKILARIRGLGKPFLWVPALRTMYDSSNRAFQAIHCRGIGVRTLRRDLRLHYEHGFRQYTFSTWNDVNETMLLPSTRNVWGYNDLLRYYHSLTETGKSPFAEPQFIFAYEPEVLLGDLGYFQCLILPETNTLSSDYTVTVRLEDLHGKHLMTLGSMAQTIDETQDVFAEMRYAVDELNAPDMVVVPRVEIRRIDTSSAAQSVLYRDLLLPPMRLRYNKLHYYTPYAISLAHVDQQTALSLAVADTAPRFGELARFTATVDGKAALRRVNLNESCLSVGAFRTDDTAAATAATPDLRRLFVRLHATGNVKATATLSSGTLVERYQYHWDPAQATRAIGAATAEIPLGGPPQVCRVSAPLASAFTLTLPGAEAPFLSATLADLGKAPVRAAVQIDGKEVVVTAQLTSDMTDENTDYPIPATAELVRDLPLPAPLGASRIFHAWALTAADTVAYSRPVALTLSSAEQRPAVVQPTTPLEVPYIRTGGVFDDFVNDSSPAARNPFTLADIATRSLPAREVPYVCLDFNEGLGRIVNDSGTGQQLGRGWLGGDTEWVADGWEGSALRLGDGKVALRSKTFPHGAYTVSLRVLVRAVGDGRTMVEEGEYYIDQHFGPLRLALRPDGTVQANHYVLGAEAQVQSLQALPAGWNHVVAVYDLRSLRLYVNGELVANADSAPAYKRSHSVPYLGSSRIVKESTPSDILIDQVEIIGTSLSPTQVKTLQDTGRWTP